MGEWAVLAYAAERPTHGFAIARAMGPDGEVGRVWSLSRPLVYRAIDLLAADGLVEERGVEPGIRGPARTVLGVTPRGRRLVARWLREPVGHVRDVRSLLLLKLLFLDRRGLDPAPLLHAQAELLRPLVAALDAQAAASRGFERMLGLWRHESAAAALRFVESVEAGDA